MAPQLSSEPVMTSSEEQFGTPSIRTKFGLHGGAKTGDLSELKIWFIVLLLSVFRDNRIFDN